MDFSWISDLVQAPVPKVNVRQRRSVFSILVAIICLGCGFAPVKAVAQRPGELDSLVKQIDMQLYRQSEADVRNFLDRLIEKYWFSGRPLQANYDTGGHGALPAMWFRGYELLGDKKYLRAGLEWVDAILQTQNAVGLFPASATLVRNGQSRADQHGRLEDEYNFVQFALVCYAYKLTRAKKYRDSALKHAAAIRRCQDPSRDKRWQGPWPHTWHDRPAPTKGRSGYEESYMLNDYTTWDGMRTMMMAFKLSGDKKFIQRIDRLPAYILQANVGLGNVRGWRGQTDVWNETTWQRAFEGPLIDPRNFNRFACPMLTYFAAVTGKDVGLNMVRESYDWLKYVEHRDGWAYKFAYDGREAYTGDYRNMLRSDLHNRKKVILDCAEQVLQVTEKGGVLALKKWYGSRPTGFNEKQYLAARIRAAKRVTNANFKVRLCAMDNELDAVTGNFLRRVRQRPLQSPDLATNKGWVWVWWRPNRPHPYRGWATWQYVWDVRVALGKIDADTAAWGGRGLESAGAPTWFFPEWDCIGDWSTKAIEVENWTDIPFDDELVHVKRVTLDPASMTLEAGSTREIKANISPANATCQTGTWTVDGDWGACWVQPHMLKQIDPNVIRPVYPRGGKMKIHAGFPHRVPAKATITFTSTDGTYQATCSVTINRKKNK